MSLIKRNKKDDNLRSRTDSRTRVPTYSYHNVRSETELKTGRDPKKLILSENKIGKIVNRVGATIFLLVCLISLVSILSLSSVPRVIQAGDTSNNTLFNLYKPALSRRSQQLFASSVFNKDKITVNSNGIAAELAKEFPEFSDISISMPLIGQHPIIYVTQSTPAIVLSNTSGEYLLNTNGVAILKSNTKNSFNYLNLPTVQDLSGLNIIVGQDALTSQNVSFIQTVAYQLAVRKYQITSYTLPAGSSELDIQLAKLPYSVKFNLEDNSPKLQVGRYLAVANYFKQNNINASSYVDVRTDGRAFYK